MNRTVFSTTRRQQMQPITTNHENEFEPASTKQKLCSTVMLLTASLLVLPAPATTTICTAPTKHQRKDHLPLQTQLDAHQLQSTNNPPSNTHGQHIHNDKSLQQSFQPQILQPLEYPRHMMSPKYRNTLSCSPANPVRGHRQAPRWATAMPKPEL